MTKPEHPLLTPAMQRAALFAWKELYESGAAAFRATQEQETQNERT